MNELLAVGCCTLVFMGVVFIISLKLKRLDVADIARGNAFLVIALSVAVVCFGSTTHRKRFEGKPGWDAYKKRTSKFIPLPLRK